MGYKVKEYREALGMTQEELSIKSGVSRGTIVALENDKESATTTATLRKVAKALGVTISHLFFDQCV